MHHSTRRRACSTSWGLVVALAAASGSFGCSSSALRGDEFSDGTVKYEVVSPGAGWKEISVENANVAWLHEESAAAMLVNSHCEGVEDAPLEVLTKHLTFGMEDREVLEERRIEKSRRKGLETTLNATIDGVERRLIVFVLKKDGCVYDIVLSTSPQSLEAVRPGYERVRDRFDVRPRADR